MEICTKIYHVIAYVFIIDAELTRDKSCENVGSIFTQNIGL